jgi:hypothetical protein
MISFKTMVQVCVDWPCLNPNFNLCRLMLSINLPNIELLAIPRQLTLSDKSWLWPLGIGVIVFRRKESGIEPWVSILVSNKLMRTNKSSLAQINSLDNKLFTSLLSSLSLDTDVFTHKAVTTQSNVKPSVFNWLSILSLIFFHFDLILRNTVIQITIFIAA